MRTSSRFLAIALTALATMLIAGFNNCGPSSPPLNSLSLLPTDASASCTVSPSTFNTWFQSGSVSLNGVVNPANSVTFPNVPNCSFYQWAMQDFLWLTSPAPATYGGGGGRILDSPAFFDVTPPAADGSRTFLPHTAGLIRPVALRAAQPNAQGLQLIFDTAGTPIQVKLASKGTLPLVLNTAGQQVQVVHARLGAGRKPILLDGNGKVIQVQHSQGLKPVARTETVRAEAPLLTTAQKFIVDGIPIFTDPSLAVIDVEQGEADPPRALAGAVPYLKLLGTVAGGWLMAKGALAAEARLEARTGDVGFNAAKLATARFYAEHVLPAAPGLLPGVTGGATIMGFDLERF